MTHMLITNKWIVLLAALVLLPLAGGCGSRFAGEWVQEQAVARDGSVSPVGDDRRLALQFIPPSSVRVGFYSDASKVVEDDTVAMSDYQTIQNRSVALFGAYTARVEDGTLITYIGTEERGRFRRLKGQSVFPPLVRLPQLVRATEVPSVEGVNPADAVPRLAPEPIVAAAE
jgi:hypothetical protein